MSGKIYEEALPIALQNFEGDDLAASVFIKKYALNDGDKYYEFGMDDLIKRLKNGMLKCEREKFGKNEQQIEDLKKQYKLLFKHFLFGGRILYALENPFDTTATLSNCYVSEVHEDSIEGIFDTAKKQARIFSKGGGVGFDITKLRPAGAKVNNSAKTTTGSVSFMDLYSLVTGLIGQHGRRGALMLSISVTHPDIIDFIKVKGGVDKSKVQYANISVRITNKFMESVEQNSDWEMYFTLKDGSVFKKTEKAHVIWDLLVESNRKGAEPGILFWDNILDNDTCSCFEESTPVSTNPCGEQPLGIGQACCLGSVNLSSLVKNAFDNPVFDFETFREIIRLGVRALDNIDEINLGRHPLEENEIAAKSMRRIGLGVTGLADMLVKMNIKYDTQEAVDFLDKVFKIFKIESIGASVELAKERGAFPLWSIKKGTKEFDNYINHHYWNDIKDTPIYQDFLKYGIRNIGLNTVAPNGSLSIIIQSSSGIEPIFRTSYMRTVHQAGKEGKKTNYEVFHPLVQEYNEKNGKISHLKNANFITSDKIDWKKRVEVQAVIQKYISQSISSTINLPKDTKGETIDQIYRYAWKSGLKGITVYVDGCREGVLNECNKEHDVLDTVKFPKEGDAHFKVIKSEGKKWYVFYTMDPETKLPNSIFVNTNASETNILTEEILEHLYKLADKYIKNGHLENLKKKVSHQNNINKIARTFSLLLRHRIPIIEIIKQIDDVNPPIFSFIFQIKKLLSMFIEGKDSGEKCPECSGKIIYTNGCKMCADCGFSKC